MRVISLAAVLIAGVVVIPAGHACPAPFTLQSPIDSHPTWSPDGRRVAFARFGGTDLTSVYVVPVTRPGAASYVTAGSGPSWSSRGELAFLDPVPIEPPPAPDAFLSCGSSTQTDVFAVTRNGGSARVTRTDLSETSVAWAPDGRRLAFGWDLGIGVANRDGSGRRRLTAHAFDPGLFTLDSDPSWSPDGHRLVFARVSAELRPSVPPPERAPVPPQQSTELMLVNDDGIGERLLTDTQDFNESQPAWSPAGATIAFAESNATGSFVAVMDAGGGPPSILARGTQPAWSPDGTRLAYVAPTRKGDRIFVMRADGSSKRQLTH